MPDRPPIRLPWPRHGLMKQTALAEQPPLSTASCLNVRPRSTIEGRERGGSRPGLIKAFDEQLGSGAKVDLLTSVSYVAAGDVSWTDDFDAGGNVLDPAIWSAASWVPNGMPAVDNGGNARTFTGSSSHQGAVRAFYAVDTANVYWVELFIVPYLGNWCGKYRIYARMNNTTPNASSSGIEAELVMTGATGSYTGALKVNGSVVATFTPGTAPVDGAWFKVRINGNNIKAKFAGTQLLGGSGVAISSHGSNVRTGFGFEATFVPSPYAYGICMADQFRIRSKVSDSGHRTRLIAASNGQLYRESEDEMVTVGGAGSLASGVALQAAEYLQKVYIANWSPSASVNPKVYDPLANTITNWTATAGTTPVDCKLICRYSDRVWLGAPKSALHQWFASRQGNPLDWDYVQTDAGSAIAGQTSEAGVIGEPLTAMLPVGDDYLVFGCIRSLWVLRGDPNYGGRIDNLSHEVGIISAGAVCTTPDGHTVFVSHDGLYTLAPGASSKPSRVSRDRMPVEWLALDPQLYNVTLRFDVEENGVHAFVTDFSGGASKHYFMDWKTESFWPVDCGANFDPLVLHAYTSLSLPDLSGVVLMGGRDGYIRRFDRATAKDDGTNFASHVYLGPLPMGTHAEMESVLNTLRATLAFNSGKVAWSIHPGTTDDDALMAAAAASGTWTSGSTHGVQYTERPRLRAGAAYVKLANGENGVAWSLEDLTATVVPGGHQRLS